MATFKNPANEQHELSVLAQGVLATDRFTFNLAASYATGAGADESLIVLGYVPSDCKLVEHLSRLYLPILDTNGAPTGDYEVGTEADTAALLATAAAETAASARFGEDWIRQTTSIGSKTERTAIVLRVSNVIATLGTGTIVFEPVFRAWNPFIDG